MNARLTQQKRLRLTKLFDSGFTAWFLETYPTHDAHDAVTVRERLAAALETEMDRTTVVFAMKVYDIVALLVTGSYNALPADVPISCDLQVTRVAKTAGLVDTDNTAAVIDAWAAVMEGVNTRLDQPVSLLRIDSIVWQSVQIIGSHGPDM